MVEMIVAISNGNVIGYKGKMPWGRLHLDLAHFKKITDGQTIVVGFNTAVSIENELAGREVLVLTKDPKKLELYPWCRNWRAIESDKLIIEIAKKKRMIISGGEKMYNYFLRYATAIHLTRIQAEFEGDTFFPSLFSDEWSIKEYDFHEVSKKNAYPLSLEKWVRRECVEEKKAA